MFPSIYARRSAHKAFTLIELLVVIAIIAILAAILFPVFAQAREKARQTACLSNTKQIALGIMQYAQDFDEVLPVAGFNAQNRGRWQHQLFPYIKNVDVLTCPNTPLNKWVRPAAGALGQDNKGGYGWSYALGTNVPCTAGDAERNVGSGYSLAAIAKPADTIVVGDTGFNGTAPEDVGWTMLAADPRKAAARTFNQPGLYPQFRHNVTQTAASFGGRQMPVAGRANFCFLDGHAKSLNIATAMASAATEDGTTLRLESSGPPNHQCADIEYLLWNIY